MKKLFVIFIGLVSLDQAIKILISNFFINANIVLLPNILFFRPIQNTNLNWIASILEYKTPLLLMLVIQIFVLTIVILIYRYCSFLWVQGKKFLYGMLLFYISGLTCSFIDVVFWGGSLDFLGIFDWFTFDLKDVYLDIGTAFLLSYFISYDIKVYYKMSKAERKQTSIWIWIKKGMPSVPIE